MARRNCTTGHIRETAAFGQEAKRLAIAGLVWRSRGPLVRCFAHDRCHLDHHLEGPVCARLVVVVAALAASCDATSSRVVGAGSTDSGGRTDAGTSGADAGSGTSGGPADAG